MKPEYKYLYIVSALMLITGAALGIVHHIVFDAIYLLGAIGYGLYFILAADSNADIRTKRLVRMNVFASVLFVVSALARFGLLDAYGQQLWILFLVLGLVFMLYTNAISMFRGKGKN
ncbi:MAG: hypothetical protein Q4A64_05495 [Porphyromonadaceae bacterium]|nr:hypothetical protein [Porphyromonadaceae bacterium]